jgi:oligopeptidase B
MMNGKRLAGLAIVLIALAVLLMPLMASAELKPPVAKIVPKIDSSFGDIRTDNYFWLRNKENPEVINYIKAENAFTDSVMKPTEALQKSLYDEMLARIKETDLSLPDKHKDFYYYSRTEKGKAYATFCRKKGTLDAPEEIILDQNKLAEGKKFLSLGALDVSPDQNLLAFSTDTLGNERYELVVKNLSTGQMLPDKVVNTENTIAWGNDNKTLFYVTRDEEANRPFKLWRHVLGTDSKDDKLVYHEKDSAFSVSISRTRSEGYLLMGLGSITTTEFWYLDANHPDGDFKLLQARRPDVQYQVEHHGDNFVILTNDGARNFKLMQTPIAATGKENWKELIPYNDSVFVEGYDVFNDWLVAYERIKGLQQIMVMNWKTGDKHFVEFPEPVYATNQGTNIDYKTDVLRFGYMSMVTPRSIYDYNMSTRKMELKKQTQVLGGYDPKKYEQAHVYAKADDGALVPICLVYKKGLVKDGSAPLWLYGYGAYGISTDPWFSSSRISLLDRGFVFAIAQIRGGAEMGRQWYEDGKEMHKKNTFTDFIACAEYLVKEKYTSPAKLVANGGSAGGLLMGAITNMRPDLFKIVVAEVPFVDLINTELDASLPLTVEEWEEWGDPNKEADYKYMKSYSPYDNVVAKAYPNMLIEGGLNDTRVSYWEPTKWTAKLRALKTDTNRLLLKIEMGSGHGGVSGRYDQLKNLAFDYAYVFDVLGIK